MPYDQDSFLAGLAVGRTLWRPHRDYGDTPVPTGYSIIGESEWMVERAEWYGPTYEYIAYKNIGAFPGFMWGRDASSPVGWYVYALEGSNSTAMFNAPIPSRFRKLLVDVEAEGIGDQYNLSSIGLFDEYGLTGIYGNSFVGTALRLYQITDYTTEKYFLDRQVIEFDISDINQDLWVGLHRCDCKVTIYSIVATMS